MNFPTADEMFKEITELLSRDDLQTEQLEDGWERVWYTENGLTHSVYRKVEIENHDNKPVSSIKFIK